MRKELKIDPAMKELWPDTKVGCFWYRVNVEQKNEALWSYLKKEIYKQVKDAIFDYGVNEIPNIKESRAAYKAFGKDPQPLPGLLGSADPEDRPGERAV